MRITMLDKMYEYVSLNIGLNFMRGFPYTFIYQNNQRPNVFSRIAFSKCHFCLEVSLMPKHLKLILVQNEKSLQCYALIRRR